MTDVFGNAVGAWTLQQYQVTVPAQTPIDDPQVTDLPVTQNTVVWVSWRVPPGPNGQMGFYLSMGGIQVVPAGTLNWVIANDEEQIVSLTNLPDSGAWQVTAYNLGAYAHSVTVRFAVTPVQVQAASSPYPTTVIPSSSLTS